MAQNNEHVVEVDREIIRTVQKQKRWKVCRDLSVELYHSGLDQAALISLRELILLRINETQEIVQLGEDQP